MIALIIWICFAVVAGGWVLLLGLLAIASVLMAVAKVLGGGKR